MLLNLLLPTHEQENCNCGICECHYPVEREGRICDECVVDNHSPLLKEDDSAFYLGGAERGTVE